MLYLDKFNEILKLKRYSRNTIESYNFQLKIFIEKSIVFVEKPQNIKNKEILLTIINIIKSKNYGASSQKQLIGAVSLFYKELFRRKIDFSTIYPSRKDYYLPIILSAKDVGKIIDSISNLKHKTIIMAIYGLGLRISEVINLKITDIDSNRMLVHIKNSKGNKDRVIMLPQKLLEQFRSYFKEYKPKIYLFEGQKGNRYTQSSIRKVFNNAKLKSKVNNKATVHTLRHSFATHLLENGTDIRIIKELLGHKSINTTLIYTRVSNKSIQNIKSPIEFL